MDRDLREKIVAEARGWAGVRFRHCGRSRRGVDCIGLLVAVYSVALGTIIDATTVVYERRPTSAVAFAAVAHFADRIAPNDAGPGDIVQMRYGGQSSHFAILTPQGIIHSAAQLHRVVEHAIPSGSEGMIVAFWRIKGVPPWRN